MKVNYDDYWKTKRGNDFGKISDYQINRLNIVKKYLDDGTVKDIGCGEGSLLLNLMEEVNFKKVYGVDISTNTLNFVKKHGVIPVKADLNKDIKKIPNTDHTLVFELLEHVNNSEEILLQLLKTTKKTLIFSVPNTGFIAHRLRLLFGSFPLQWRLNPAEHIRFWTYRDMKWWLRQLKLKDKSKIILYEGIPLLNKIWPSLFCMGQIVVIKK